MVYKRCGQRAIMNYRGELLVRPGPVEQHVQLRLCGEPRPSRAVLAQHAFCCQGVPAWLMVQASDDGCNRLC